MISLGSIGVVKELLARQKQDKAITDILFESNIENSYGLGPTITITIGDDRLTIGYELLHLPKHDEEGYQPYLVARFNGEPIFHEGSEAILTSKGSFIKLH